MTRPKKNFYPLPQPLRPLAKGYGACLATDMITVEGRPVRYMYREAPDNNVDSGWRFFAGFETDEYTDDPANSSVFDVNTIANYDPSIVPHLDAPPGSSLEKPDGATSFVIITHAKPLPEEFPVVQGRYEMTKEWAVTLPGPFKRRFEDGSLVLWRRGLTLWIVAWGNEPSISQDQRCDGIRSEASRLAFDHQTERGGNVLRHSYRLTEKRNGAAVHALYAFAFSDAGHVQMAIYFDVESDLDTARTIWRSLQPVGPAAATSAPTDRSPPKRPN